MDTKNLNKRKLEDEVEIDAEKLKKSEFFKEKGNELYKKSMFDEALDFYFKAITLNPTDHRCYGNIGQILINKSRYREAKEVLNEAINLNSNYTKAYYRLGLVEKYMKNYDEALKNFDKVLKLEPDNKASIKECDDIRKSLGINQTRDGSDQILKSNIFTKMNDTNGLTSSKKPNKDLKCAIKSIDNRKHESLTRSFKNLTLPKIEIKIELPANLPKTAYEFNKFWREIKERSMKIDYLKFVGAEIFLKLFRQNLEPDLFSEIIVLLSLTGDKKMIF